MILSKNKKCCTKDKLCQHVGYSITGKDLGRTSLYSFLFLTWLFESWETFWWRNAISGCYVSLITSPTFCSNLFLGFMESVRQIIFWPTFSSIPNCTNMEVGKMSLDVLDSDIKASSPENIHYRHSNFTEVTFCH